MNYRTIAAVVSLVATITSHACAQDWPQWRGPHRDGKAAGFRVPASWPQELTQKWKATVGDGVATPALVGDKVYVFARQEGNEILRCLNAATGEELWQNQHPAAAVTGPAAGFAGPRSSPTVEDGKIVTLGAQGVLSCLDAETGELLWRNDKHEGSIPRFATSSSPLIVDGLCIAQLGSERDGGIMAFDLATGNEKWRWRDDGPAYGSPVVVSVGETRAVMVPTNENMVALRLEDGKLLRKAAYQQGRYNAATPIVVGQMVVYAGPTSGTTAEKLVPDGEAWKAEKLWANADNSLIYNTPVVRDGLIFGVSIMNNLFCINAETGQTAWNAPIGGAAGQQPEANRNRGGDRPQARAPQRGDAQGGRGRDGRGGGGRRRGGGGRAGYGSIVDAGSVLVALTPSAELLVFQPNGEAYTEVAKYKVADSPTHAYPVLSGNRIFVKDAESLTLWTVE